MLTSICVDDWDELIPWEQVTLVRKGAPDVRRQVRFHHAIAGRGGGWQAMFEVDGQIDTRYTSADWTVIRVIIGGVAPSAPTAAAEEEDGCWHNGSSRTHNPIFIPTGAPAVD